MHTSKDQWMPSVPSHPSPIFTLFHHHRPILLLFLFFYFCTAWFLPSFSSPRFSLLDLSCAIHASPPPFSFVIVVDADIVFPFMLVSLWMDVYIQTPLLCEHVFMTLRPSLFFLCRKGQGEETRTRKKGILKGVCIHHGATVLCTTIHIQPPCSFLFFFILIFFYFFFFQSWQLQLRIK